MEAWQDSALAGNIYIEAFRMQLERVVPTPRIPEWEQIAMKVQDYAELAARGRLSVTDALTALDRDADNILEKRRWMVKNGR
jgi:multiple sugar transport system substrate-binding protein